MKTKKQLLAVMERMSACGHARWYVQDHASDSALRIGLECDCPEWLLWFLWRRLTRAGREVLSARLGYTPMPNELEPSWLSPWAVRPVFCYEDADKLDRRVINDCWRAWCRS